MDLFLDVQYWFDLLPKLANADVVFIFFSAILVCVSVAWLSIKLMLNPPEYYGLNDIVGWQGVLPASIRAFVSSFGHSLLQGRITVREIFHVLDPDRMIEQAVRVIKPRVDELVDDIMIQHNPVAWENLPAPIKNRVYFRIHRALPLVVEKIVDDLEDAIEEVVSPEELQQQVFKADKRYPGEWFSLISQPRVKLLYAMAVVVGLFFGLLQAIFFLHGWVGMAFPLILWCGAGLVVGFYFALFLHDSFCISKAVRERARMQFIHQVSRDLSHDVFTIRNLLICALSGSASDKTRAIFRRRVDRFIDSAALKILAQLSLGPSGFVHLKKSLVDKVYEVALWPFEDRHQSEARRESLETLFRMRLSSVSSAEIFQVYFSSTRKKLGKLFLFVMLLASFQVLIQWALIA